MRCAPRSMAATVLGMAVATACSTAPTAERPPPSPLALEVRTGKLAEECFSLAAGERIEYRFEASVPLDFDLHTHRGREVVAPVRIERTREQAGTFTSPHREDYCLTWTNRGAIPAYVKGEWRRLR